MDWRTMRYHLCNALEQLRVREIYLLDQENNVISVCIVLEDGALLPGIRKITELRIIDRLIETRAPEIYAQYLFCYEVWEKSNWSRQRVLDVMHRRTGRTQVWGS